MTLLTSRQFFLRFVESAITGENALYGSETYGADPFSYGQEATETVFPSTEYSVLAGSSPDLPAWTYRVGDQNKFSCAIVDSKDPSVPIDVSAINTASVLLWNASRFDQQLPWYRTYQLIPNETNNQLERTWLPGDLSREGRFRVQIHVLFDSGRTLTVESNDEVMLYVNSSIDADGPEHELRGRWL